MTHQEKSELKESLRIEYIAINNFDEKFLFWEKQKSNLRYTDSLKYVNEFIQAKEEKDTNDFEQRKVQGRGAIIGDAKYSFEIARIRNLIDEEDEAKGIKEPLPCNDREKAFVAKYWIDYWQKQYESEPFSILSFEKYKENLFEDLEKIKSIDDKIEEVRDTQKRYKKYLETLTNYDVFVLESPQKFNSELQERKISSDTFFPKVKLTELIIRMLRRGMFDYCNFFYQSKYRYYKNDFDFYMNVAKFLSPMQFQKYLTELLSELQTKPLIQTEQDRGIDLGFSDNQLLTLHKELIGKGFLEKIGIEHFKSAFSGTMLDNYEKLKWIDKAKNHHVNIQTVFQLLYSCNIKLAEKTIIRNEVKVRLNSIFSNDWGNINSKYNDFEPLKTERHKIISSLIETLNLNQSY